MVEDSEKMNLLSKGKGSIPITCPVHLIQVSTQIPKFQEVEGGERERERGVDAIKDRNPEPKIHARTEREGQGEGQRQRRMDAVNDTMRQASGQASLDIQPEMSRPLTLDPKHLPGPWRRGDPARKGPQDQRQHQGGRCHGKT
jgi:hypothetical protein